jgi:hypothetical protein
MSLGEICESYERTIRRPEGIPFLRAGRERISVILFPCVINLHVDDGLSRPEQRSTYWVDSRRVAGATRHNIHNGLG